jgi:hypothetical protein
MNKIAYEKLKKWAKKDSEKLLSDIPSPLLKPFREGQIPSSNVDAVLQEYINNTVAQSIEKGDIKPKQAPILQEHLKKYFKQYQKPIEALSYRREALGALPVSPGELALTGGLGLAIPKAWEAYKRRKDPTIKPMTWGQTAKFSYGPSALPYSAAFGGAITALSPLSDPLYQRGDRSYLESLREGFKGQAEAIGIKGEEARKKYGPIAGSGVSMLHGLLNPIPSIAYGANSLRNLMMGKEGSDKCVMIQSIIKKALKTR